MAGWGQQMAAITLLDSLGEDAARVAMMNLIVGGTVMLPRPSGKPTNWPDNDKKRVDLGMVGRSANAVGWYGGIEIKWPKKNSDYGSLRVRLVEDAYRLVRTDTNNL